MPKVVAVVVFYKPNLDYIINLIETSKKVDKVFIFWNKFSQEDQQLLNIINQNNKLGNILVETDDQNKGIAYAFNRGVKFILSLNSQFQFLLTLDQDSTLLDDTVSQLISVYKSFDDYSKIGIVFPSMKNKNTKQISVKVKSNNTYDENYDAFSSGSLINRTLLDTGLTFNENLFIYHVDTDFNLTAKHLGFKSLESKKSLLMHNEGDMELIKRFGFTFGLTNHSVVAHYYLARNEVYMLKKYFITNFRWSLNSIKWFVKYKLKAFLLEKNKYKKIKYTAIGLIDGIIGKYGEKHF